MATTDTGGATESQECSKSTGSMSRRDDGALDGADGEDSDGVLQDNGCWEEAVQAVRGDVVADLRRWLSRCPKLRSQRDSVTGRTLLHEAAASGARSAVGFLLEAGSLWHATDASGATAGELAMRGKDQGMFDLLVSSAARAEILARREPPSRTLEEPRPKRRRQSGVAAPAQVNEALEAYLQMRLRYEQGRLLTEDDDGKGESRGRAIMMGWEAPLMERHAEHLAPQEGGDVLNVGFGLGIIDGFLQQRRPRSHTIIEAHPDVLAEMRRRGWMGDLASGSSSPSKNPGVVVLEGRWQDVVNAVPAESFDGIFFDTYEESYTDLRQFLCSAERLLRPGGRLSFFNGFASYNIFYHAIYCRIAQTDLWALHLPCKFLPIDLGGAIGDGTWHGVKRKYWKFETYFLPLAEKPLRTQATATAVEADVQGFPAVVTACPATGLAPSPWREWPLGAVQVGDKIDAV